LNNTPDWSFWPKDLTLLLQEEIDRMDIFDKFFQLARKGTILSYPLPTDRAPAVLDLGTGSGIWAINLAEK
jgi:ribosomal protein L11 methylase PrmA